MNFRVLPAKVHFEARDEICLPAGDETNVFRGALGLALRNACCESGCPGVPACPRASECPYARFFEPRWPEGPSGYRNAPRPFILRWAGPCGGRLAPGTRFSASLNLFDVQAPPLRQLEDAFRNIAGCGIGPGRGKALFESIEQQPVLCLPLCGPEAAGRVTIRFATPTELKSGGTVCSEPEFPVLIERLAERVGTLGRLYQDWPAWDYRDLLDVSHSVRLLDWEWSYRNRYRRSSRTGLAHPLGGFTGTATYEGPIGIFLPLLEIAHWTGLGRQTVWGKGELRVENVELT
jgi:hypothetical protein